MREKPNLKALSDDDLLRRLSELLRQSRRVEADLVAHIAEVDARGLYAREASPSMFAYCTERLHLSEPEAYLRIAVARASRRHPVLLEMLADGRLHLSAIERLAPHLSADNRDALLERAAHKTKREIEELVAELSPRPRLEPSIRKLPVRRGSEASRGAPTSVSGASHGACELRPDGASSAIPQLRPNGVGAFPVLTSRQNAVIEPVAQDRVRVRFDASADLRDKLERLQALMRSSVPDGDLGKIVDAAITEKLERLEARRFAKTRKPRKSLAETDTRPRSRHIPAAVRRAVHERDGGRCTFRDERGRRCTKRHHLEFHHREPFGRGGDHSVKTLCLMCRTHNTLLAEQDYGKEVIERHRRSQRLRESPAVRVARSAPP